MSDENDPLSVCCRHLANSQNIIEEKNAEIARLRGDAALQLELHARMLGTRSAILAWTWLRGET